MLIQEQVHKMSHLDKDEFSLDDLITIFNKVEKIIGKDEAYRVCLRFINEYFKVSRDEAIEILDKRYHRKVDENELAELQRIIESHNRDWLG